MRKIVSEKSKKGVAEPN